MSIIVKKFGGTSVGSIERIQHVARMIAKTKQPDEQVVLVVSAMAGATDDLFKKAYEISEHPSRRELDMLLTAGERISMSLLSLALQEEGLPAISFTGSQSGIITDSKHGNARITHVNPFRIQEELEKGKVVIVAGFQGVSALKEITTLGRGGSDTSAVALACYLHAEKCEIFTDVDGVFSADPRIVSTPYLIPAITYNTMLALAYNGSKVLHPRAVEFASKYNMPVEIKSSFTFAPGTMVIKDTKMEERIITAISHKDHLCQFVLRYDQYPQVLTMLHDLELELFNYMVSDPGILRLTVEEKYKTDFEKKFRDYDIPIEEFLSGLGTVSLVGMGLTFDLELVSDTLTCLQKAGIEPLRMQRNDLGMMIIMSDSQVKEAVHALHQKLM